MGFSELYLSECLQVLQRLAIEDIDRVIANLIKIRERKGRLFVLGVGGSAANACHVVNDFRKLAGFEAYSPTDNVAELTARTNDDGWESVFETWLAVSRLRPIDGILVLSVGGGSLAKNVSPNLVRAVQYAKRVGATILGLVGRDGGYTAEIADACVIVPVVNASHTTPHSEAFQAVLWHLMVSHPRLKLSETKWEATR